MRRPQFTLKTLLWLPICVACFFGGAKWADLRWVRERTRLKEEIEEWTVRARSADYYNQRLIQQQRENEHPLLFPPNATPEQMNEGLRQLRRKHRRAI
jgi:hypothetical protein